MREYVEPEVKIITFTTEEVMTIKNTSLKDTTSIDEIEKDELD